MVRCQSKGAATHRISTHLLYVHLYRITHLKTAALYLSVPDEHADLIVRLGQTYAASFDTITTRLCYRDPTWRMESFKRIHTSRLRGTDEICRSSRSHGN